MTSLKLKFRPSRVGGKAGTVYIQVIHGRVVRQIGTGCRLHPHEWADGQVAVQDRETERGRHLMAVRRALAGDMDRLGRIVGRLEQAGGTYTADQVVDAYRLPDDDEGKLCVFSRRTAGHMRRIGKARLAETYTTSVNSFMRFRGEKGDIRMEEIDGGLMKEYEHYLTEECGLNPNTASFYMRNLRALYNRAVEKGLTRDRSPFRHVYTGIARTAKRAVSPEVIRDMRGLDLSMHPRLEMARDLFVLNFFLRGIPFVDLSMLRCSSIQDGYLRYRRRKTNRELRIKWERPMQEIVSRYHRDGSPYLLPIITDAAGDILRQYRNALHRMNIHLKKIGGMVDCPIGLTTYCARHGWASAARDMNVPLPVISEAMGHGSENTTRIYLKALDNSVIDEANKAVMDAVRNG